MHKVVNQIRDLALIENELKSSLAGVLAMNLENEKLAQIVTPFIYLDKNVYVFFSEGNELFSSIHFDSTASFTIMRLGKAKKTKSMDYDPTYNIFSISIKGMVRKVDDSKLSEDLRQNYLLKYKKSTADKIDFSALTNIIIIDTEEIQALEETGG